MKLYELDKAMEEFEFKIDEDGVIENADEFERLKLEQQDKQENVGLYIKNLVAEAKAIKDERKALATRLDRIDSKIDWLKGYLHKSLNGEKFETARVQVSYRKSDQVSVLDEDILPEQFFRVKKEVNKTELRKALKDHEVQGAELIEKQNIIIK